MYELMVEKTVAAAHALKDYPGDCSRVHGHNFRFQIFVEGEHLNHLGMLIDFKWLKAELLKLLDKLDHQFLNDVFDFSPTTELLAKHTYETIAEKLPKGVTVSRVKVWENDHSYAAYRK